MLDWPILSLMIGFPLLGGVLLMILPTSDDRIIKMGTLWISVVNLLLGARLWWRYDPTNPELQFVERTAWIPNTPIEYFVGVDGISIYFILLACVLTPICILASWESITKRWQSFGVAFLVLESFMIGTFSAQDSILFYVFFEAVLIPMYMIIGTWGGVNRIYAAYKFFLFTLAGSVLMLVAVIAMWLIADTTDIQKLQEFDFAESVQIWLWLGFFASFAVKTPMWPVHTWLPDAHVQAPTAGSVILAGVLLKMGGYGFIRFSLPMLPEASEFFTPLIYGLSAVAVIYGSYCALAQTDFKKLVAYSSVAHMGFVTIGLFGDNPVAVTGAVYQMLSHGVVSAALFLCVGAIYDRMHTREISKITSLAREMPRYARYFVFFSLASIGLPGTSGFVGEFLVLVGVWKSSQLFAIIISWGMVLGAVYMLYLVKRVVFTTVELPQAEKNKLTDLKGREIAYFIPLIFLVLWMGIYPSTFSRPVERSLAAENLYSNRASQFSAEEKHTSALPPVQSSAQPLSNR